MQPPSHRDPSADYDVYKRRLADIHARYAKSTPPVEEEEVTSVEAVDGNTSQLVLDFVKLLSTAIQDPNYNAQKFTPKQWEMHKYGKGAHQRANRGYATLGGEDGAGAVET
jgi:hypothetical protein